MSPLLLVLLLNHSPLDPRDELAARLGFSEALKPLEIDAGELGLHASACKACHAAEHAAWTRSRHAASTTNALFEQGHRAEPRQRCVMCHAPLLQQQPQVRRGRVSSNSLAAEGVNCAVCHLREGAILTASTITDEARAAHPMKREPLLASSEFCGACHQFRFTTPNQRKLIDTHAQLTYSEWRDWGGQATCQRCHMADHSFPSGAHDDEALKRSLVISLEGRALTLEPRNVGHRFPTGDVYRQLIVEAEVDGAWVEQHRAGLTLGLSRKDGLLLRTRKRDNRLGPRERRAVPLPAAAARVRVIFEFTTEANAIRGRLPADVHRKTLFEAPVQDASVD